MAQTFELSQFIILDRETDIRKLSIKKKAKFEEYKFTATGRRIYPMFTYLPVIKRGKGCIGLGLVKKLIISENVTEIIFEFTNKLSRHESDAYYALYRNQVSVQGSTSDDVFDASEDMIIPGAISSIKPSASLKVDKSGGPSHDKVTYDEISAILSDYDDDDDDFYY